MNAFHPSLSLSRLFEHPLDYSYAQNSGSNVNFIIVVYVYCIQTVEQKKMCWCLCVHSVSKHTIPRFGARNMHTNARAPYQSTLSSLVCVRVPHAADTFLFRMRPRLNSSEHSCSHAVQYGLCCWRSKYAAAARKPGVCIILRLITRTFAARCFQCVSRHILKCW